MPKEMLSPAFPFSPARALSVALSPPIPPSLSLALEMFRDLYRTLPLVPFDDFGPLRPPRAVSMQSTDIELKASSGLRGGGLEPGRSDCNSYRVAFEREDGPFDASLVIMTIHAANG